MGQPLPAKAGGLSPDPNDVIKQKERYDQDREFYIRRCIF